MFFGEHVHNDAFYLTVAGCVSHQRGSRLNAFSICCVAVVRSTANGRADSN
jgi:hypothetical protein